MSRAAERYEPIAMRRKPREATPEEMREFIRRLSLWLADVASKPKDRAA